MYADGGPYIACAPTFYEVVGAGVAAGASARIRDELGGDALPVRSAIGVQTFAHRVLRSKST